MTEISTFHFGSSPFGFSTATSAFIILKPFDVYKFQQGRDYTPLPDNKA